MTPVTHVMSSKVNINVTILHVKFTYVVSISERLSLLCQYLFRDDKYSYFIFRTYDCHGLFGMPVRLKLIIWVTSNLLGIIIWFLIVSATVKRSINIVQVCVLMISTAYMNVMLNCQTVWTCVRVKLDVLLVATVRFRFRKKIEKTLLIESDSLFSFLLRM